MTTPKNTLSLTLKNCLEKTLYLSLFSAIAFTSASYADDTEVFRAAAGLDGGTPNVLLMFDSSASMNQNISYIEGYSTDLKIIETDGCQNDVIYVKTGTNNQLPSCGTNAVNPSAFVCEDIASLLAEIGTINARVKQRSKTSKNWTNFQDGLPDAKIDCLADQGVHGDGEVLTIVGGQVALSLTGTTDTNTFIRNSLITENRWDVAPDTSIIFGDDSFATFYTGHYLNFVNSSAATEIRGSGIDLATIALTNVINDFPTINLGIARYNLGGNSDGQIYAPIVPLSDENNRQDLIKYYLNELDGTLNGQQPMAAGQYEAYLYFKGEPITPGATPEITTPGDGVISADDNDGKNTIPSAYDTNNRYYSPITEGEGACQGNYVLFLTAGGSSGVSNGTESNINDATGKKQAADNTVATTETTLSSQYGTCGSGRDDCLDELTGFMYTNDLVDLPTTGYDENGDEIIQNVVTYGVSINAADADLDDAAIDGGGRFTKAESPAAIEAALREILNEIVGNNATFVAPSISVNNFNRLQNLNDLYYSLFTPNDFRVWDGNLKKYKLIDGEITDAYGNLAVDPDTGAFKETSMSFWTNASDPRLGANTNSPNTDGDFAELGGFASRRNRTPRDVYTNVDNDTSLTILDNLSSSNLSITNSVLNLDDPILGLTTTEQDAINPVLLNWGQGLIPNEAATAYVINDFVGDLLHTTPVVLTYFNGATDVADLDQTIYFGTNNGFIHAAKANPNASESIELFAYAPYETLSDLYTYYTNEESTTKLFGIDGPMSSWIDETDNDLIIDANEDAYLYATQRRGGSNIYALEVSDRSNPELAWKINGGVVGTDFEELGQTWSAVQHATIKNAADPANPLEVAFFAGGYDENQDTGSAFDAIASPALATKGRAIYMVNAKTGALLWRAAYDSASSESESELNLPEMTYAIPSDLRVLDVNADGYADRIYVGDLGGQIWRFDMTTPKITGQKFRITGGVIANLSKNSASDVSPLDVGTGALKNKRFIQCTVCFIDFKQCLRYLSGYLYWFWL